MLHARIVFLSIGIVIVNPNSSDISHISEALQEDAPTPNVDA